MDISHVSHCAADTVVAIFHTNREGTPGAKVLGSE